MPALSHPHPGFRLPLALVVLTYAGCVPVGCASPRAGAPAEWADRLSPTSDRESFDSAAPALQVLICLGLTHGTHTGLRLLRPGEETIFWDPAGQYGRNRDDLVRRRDVFAAGAPTMAEYVRWRFDGAGDAAVSVFEWRLAPERARYFASILTHEADGVEFETTTIGLFCCRAVCRFLERHAQVEMSIPQRWIRPEDLGEHLWSQQPARVAIFFADGSIEVFESPK